MKLYRIMAAAAVSAALFMGPASVNADAQLFHKGEKNKQTKKELVRENKQMRAMLDSLMRELEALRDTAYEVDDYVEAEKSISLLDGVAPETYSQEVSVEYLVSASSGAEQCRGGLQYGFGKFHFECSGQGVPRTSREDEFIHYPSI